MTREEIVEYNGRCARYLEIPNLKDAEGDLWDFQNTGEKIYSVRTYLLDFDRNWTSIMRVVTKIQSYGYRFYLHSDELNTKVVFTDMAICAQTHPFGGGNIIIHAMGSLPPICVLVNAVNQFLIWDERENRLINK